MFLKVYTADITPLEDAETYDYYYNKSIPYRRRKADACKLPKTKRQSVGAGILLKKALTDAGVPKNLWEFTIDESGRTTLADAAELMIDFNLSHSGNKVMCAISDCTVGCDVEAVKENTKVAKRFFTESEAALAEGDADMFTRLWTLKESFIKATGEGLNRALDSFEIGFDEAGTAHVKGDGIAPDTFSFYEINYDDGYRYSVCVKADELTPEAELVKLGLQG